MWCTPPNSPTSDTPVKRILLPALCLVLAACSSDPIVFEPEEESLSTFTTGLNGWVGEDLGLAPGSAFSVVAEAGTARLDLDAAAPGGEGVLARTFILTPEVEYVLTVEYTIENDDAEPGAPWAALAGTSVDGGPVQIGPPSPADPTGGGPATYSAQLTVTAGPPDGPDDNQSEVRVVVGLAPQSGESRTYRIDNLLVRFVRAEVAE